MDEPGSGKVSSIRHIVRLKELLHKWQNVTINFNNDHNNAKPDHPSGIPPEVTRRIIRSATLSGDSNDEGSCCNHEPPPDVPKGNLLVYVGSEQRRFIIPTVYLDHKLFKALLEKAEEEYGVDHRGGALTIPCEVETFKYLLNCIEKQSLTQEKSSTNNTSENEKCLIDSNQIGDLSKEKFSTSTCENENLNEGKVQLKN